MTATREPCSGGNCVIVEDAGGGDVYLFSSRRPADVAVIQSDEWAAFLAKAKAGEFDPPEAG